jgi:enoyl-CoA hydratase
VPLHTRQDGRVLTVTLDNPPRQLQDRALNFELERLTRALERDRSVGAVVLTGAHPRSFLTHYDVAEILAGAEITPDLSPIAFGASLRVVGAIDRLPGGARLLNNRYTAGLLSLRRVHQLYLRMNCMDKVFIAAINGTAAAGGCELALACDIRYAASSAKLGQPEINLGIIPGWGGTQRLARVAGAGVAKELILTGRTVDADEALRRGLVEAVFEPDELMEKTLERAREIASKSPLALAAAKEAVNRAFQGEHADNLAQEAETFGDLFDSEDAKEGLAAFVDRREPTFRGR